MNKAIHALSNIPFGIDFESVPEPKPELPTANVFINKEGDLMIAWRKSISFNGYTRMMTNNWYFETDDYGMRETNVSPEKWGWERLGLL